MVTDGPVVPSLPQQAHHPRPASPRCNLNMKHVAQVGPGGSHWQRSGSQRSHGRPGPYAPATPRGTQRRGRLLAATTTVAALVRRSLKKIPHDREILTTKNL